MGDWKSALGAFREKTFAKEEKVNEEHLKVGSVIKVALDESDGLVLKPGYKNRDKYIVIIGFTKEGNIIGALLINTDPATYTKELRECQFQVKKSKYPAILDYDSWLNCGNILDINKDKLIKKGAFKGEFQEDDLGYVMEFLKNTEMYTPKDKRKYGIIE